MRSQADREGLRKRRTGTASSSGAPFFAEASAKRVTGDEPQGTMGRVQTAGEAPDVSPVVSFPPSFARTFLSKKRDVWVRGRYRDQATKGLFFNPRNIEHGT